MKSANRVLLLAALVLLPAGNTLAQRGPRTSEKYQDADLGIWLSLHASSRRVPQAPSVPRSAARFSGDTARIQPELHASLRVAVLPQDVNSARKALTLDPGDQYAIRPEGNGQETYAGLVEE